MISFFVPGIPIPKGSARAFVVKGRAIITAANAKTKPWEQAIRSAAHEAGCTPVKCAVAVHAIFWFPRPKGHYGKKGVKVSAPFEYTKKPDVDKALRALLDGLTGVAFVDDSQVHCVSGHKRYVSDDGQPGMHVEIVPVEKILEKAGAE